MEAIFKATCKLGKLFFENTEDYYKYCTENDAKELLVTLKLAARIGPKMRLYAFYHGPLLDCAVIGYTYAGYEGVDKVMADYLLRSEFAKDFFKKPDGTYIPIMLDKHKMSQPRMLKFVQDCLFFIEQELKQTVPDSDTYKASKASGRKLRRVENDDNP